MSDGAPPPDDADAEGACPQCLNLIGPRTHWKDDGIGFIGYTCHMASRVSGRVMDAVRAERARQDGLWGPNPRDLGPGVWFPVLTEEIGEVAKALNEGMWAEMLVELVEVAATAQAWIEDIEHASQRVLDLDNDARVHLTSHDEGQR